MQYDVLEFGETESKEAAQTLNMHACMHMHPFIPAFGKSTVKYMSFDKKSFGKNEKIRRKP